MIEKECGLMIDSWDTPTLGHEIEEEPARDWNRVAGRKEEHQEEVMSWKPKEK